MKKVIFKRRHTKEIDTVPIVDGQLVYDVDNGNTYMDVDTDRIQTGGGGQCWEENNTGVPPKDKRKIWIRSDIPFDGGASDASNLTATVPSGLPKDTAKNTQAILNALDAKPNDVVIDRTPLKSANDWIFKQGYANFGPQTTEIPGAIPEGNRYGHILFIMENPPSSSHPEGGTGIQICYALSGQIFIRTNIRNKFEPWRELVKFSKDGAFVLDRKVVWQGWNAFRNWQDIRVLGYGFSGDEGNFVAGDPGLPLRLRSNGDVTINDEQIALDKDKVSLPASGAGVAGQFAVSDGKGGINWLTLENAAEVGM